MNSGAPVTGNDQERHRIENRRRRNEKLEKQAPTNYWRNHRGQFSVPTPKAGPASYRGQMCPGGLALEHPAADILLEYATGGCPAQTGRQWTREMLEAAVEKGPHKSAMEPEAMAYIQQEVEAKEKRGQAKVFIWDVIKDDPPPEMKISPLAAIPHKSRAYRAILDLSFVLRLQNGGVIPSVNGTTTKSAPSGAIDQLGHALKRLIHAFAEAEDDEKIFMAKWDIADGFWRLVSRPGEEWNFAYVLPQAEGEPVKIVVPTSLQMGWVESPTYFCAASETARDVIDQYVETPVGALPPHKFQQHSEGTAEFEALPEGGAENPLRYMNEVYVDDFMSLAVATSKAQLRHVAAAVMTGIHDVFPPAEKDKEDPISFKKLEKGESQFALQKELLGFDFDGEAHTLWLAEEKRAALLLTLKGWIRGAANGRGGIPYPVFDSVVQKLRHAFTAIPEGKGLLSPCNRVRALQPPVVYLHRNKALLEAIRDARTLLQESMAFPTHCKQLVQGWPDYVGVKDASGHGVGGVVIGEGAACVPTVFRMEWPDDIKADIVTLDNPQGRVTNSDLEMAGLLLLFLVMEEVCPELRHRHVALFSDNSPTVSWVKRMAARGSRVAAQLLRALALRMSVAKTSPLTPLHIAGTKNAMTDIPSRSFGSEPKWFCRTDDDLLRLFNARFPLPNQKSWTIFRPTFTTCMKVISVLRMEDTSLAEWRRLKQSGRHIGRIGSATSGLWEWTLTFRESPSDDKCDSSRASRGESGRGTTDEDARWQLERSIRLSAPLARRSPWPSG
ncbi:hypothetical protein ACHAWF_011989 [Thalassiosira exigua]